MKILEDTGFPTFDKAMRFIIILNIAGFVTIGLWYLIETYTSIEIQSSQASIMKISILIITSTIIWNIFFVKRCKICKRRLDGYYLLSESRTKGTRVCKKCFYSPEAWEKYFKIYPKTEQEEK